MIEGSIGGALYACVLAPGASHLVFVSSCAHGLCAQRPISRFVTCVRVSVDGLLVNATVERESYHGTLLNF